MRSERELLYEQAIKRYAYAVAAPCGAAPPLAALVVLVLTEWIARGTLDADTFTQYIEPHWEAYALAWALLFLVWLTVDWLTRFAPLATLVTAILGCVPAAVDFYTLQLRGEPFLPWDLMQVSEAAGVPRRPASISRPA